MNKNTILDKLLSSKAKDYTYTIAFFFTFSFFLIFVIRPNILAIVNSNKKIDELEQTDRYYEQQIDKVISIQSTFEENRNNFSLLDEAISRQPQVNKILSDLNLLVVKSNLQVDRVNIADVNLKDTSAGQRVKSITINIAISGDFESMMQFVKGVHDQRRLKFVRKLDVTKAQSESTESGKLQMTSEIEGYYL